MVARATGRSENPTGTCKYFQPPSFHLAPKHFQLKSIFLHRPCPGRRNMHLCSVSSDGQPAQVVRGNTTGKPQAQGLDSQTPFFQLGQDGIP
eukprot:6104971-Pyramimonas_sp.AAC.1